MESLRSHDFQIAYGPNDDRLHDFYIPALELSVRYDRTAGFFSSSALAIAAAGVARLIANEGRMRPKEPAGEPPIDHIGGTEPCAWGAMCSRRQGLHIMEPYFLVEILEKSFFGI